MLYTTKSLSFSVLSKTNPKADKEQMPLTFPRKSNFELTFPSHTELPKWGSPEMWTQLLSCYQRQKAMPCSHASPLTLTGSRGSSCSRSSRAPSSRDCHGSPRRHAGKFSITWMGHKRRYLFTCSSQTQTLGEMEKWRKKQILSHEFDLSLSAERNQEAVSVINCSVENTQEF